LPIKDIKQILWALSECHHVDNIVSVLKGNHPACEKPANQQSWRTDTQYPGNPMSRVHHHHHFKEHFTLEYISGAGCPETDPISSQFLI